MKIRVLCWQAMQHAARLCRRNPLDQTVSFRPNLARRVGGLVEGAEGPER
jgi:hypothetical protein